MGSEPIATPVADGIIRLALPTPFIVGRVNAYLFAGDPPVLVDTGPNSGTTLDALERAVGESGFAIEDIGRVVITHQHVDHAGLAAIIARRSGARVEMLDCLAPALADWPAAAARDDEVAASLLRSSGVEEDTITALASTGRLYQAFGSSVAADVTFADGDSLEIGGREWRVHHRPGHSPSDTIFHDPTSRILLGGDHLLEKISSNPLISAPLAGEPQSGGRPRPLPAYLANLVLTRELEVEVVLPGHGAPFGDHRRVIDERLAMHDRRASKLLDGLASGPLTAVELAKGMWGRLAVSQSYLALSEVIGHMDLLADEGRVQELPPDGHGVVRFQRVD